MKKLAIGLMSGTSFDGVDIALCEIEGHGLQTSITFLHGKTYPYSKHILHQIKQSINIEQSRIDVICSLNVEIAKEYSEMILQFCQEYGIKVSDISFIASHGQTIYHINEHASFMPSSLQLGDGSVLANLLNVTVVSNFRNADIALGGTGAPLVPYADYVLFSNNTTRALQNIGGIANVTILPKSNNLNEVIAFDNGPGNMMIDEAMRILFQKPFDFQGMTARNGSVISELLEKLLENPYLKKLPPKSTGREDFGVDYTSKIIEAYNTYKPEDIISTLTEFTAVSIVSSYKMISQTVDDVIISGGGAHNTYLLERIVSHLKHPIKTSKEVGVDIDFKEAIAFIILGNETLHKSPSNVLGATGAKKRTILGQISYV